MYSVIIIIRLLPEVDLLATVLISGASTNSGAGLIHPFRRLAQTTQGILVPDR